MNERFLRTSLIFGEENINKLNNAKVAVFGIGGVGGYVSEAIARSGVGKLTLIDGDVVSVSNINRQIIALTSTVGKYKADVMKDRIMDINPDAEVSTINSFLTPENIDSFNLTEYDYVVDAIDDVKAKLALIKFCFDNNIPIISAMGAGNKLDATGFEVSDIFKTSVCPLARIMRRELKKIGVDKLNFFVCNLFYAVYSFTFTVGKIICNYYLVPVVQKFNSCVAAYISGATGK